MGQVQSGEGYDDDDDEAGKPAQNREANQSSQQAAPAAAGRQKGNNQKCAATSNGEDNPRRQDDSAKLARYKRNLLAAVGVRGSAQADAEMTAREQHVRKLSNVSNRNIQLLSMRPRTERDNYAEGLRARRRSSLIHLILGAPARGPRFSDDLCSLSSHMSELCNFGIDYFPDHQQQQQAYGCYPVNRTVSSITAGSPSGPDLDHHHHHQDNESSRGARLQRPSSLALWRDPSVMSGAAAEAALGPLQGAPGDTSTKHHRRRSSFGSLSTFEAACAASAESSVVGLEAPAAQAAPTRRGRPSLSSIFLASIDLTGSPPAEADELAGAPVRNKTNWRAPPLGRAKHATLSESTASSSSSSSSSGTSGSFDDTSTSGRQRDSLGEPTGTTNDGPTGATATDASAAAARGRINHHARRIIHRSGSELSLYSAASARSSSIIGARGGPRLGRHASQTSIGSVMHEAGAHGAQVVSTRASTTRARRNAAAAAARQPQTLDHKQEHEGRTAMRLKETKWIIMLQVCLPFILAGFGNMAAGLVLNRMAQWEAFQRVPIFFVLLPSFVGLKGNIEMTLASRLSTLSNLGLLDTGQQRRRALATNLVLILSQAVGLSLFAAFASVVCELLMGKLGHQGQEPAPLVGIFKLSTLVVLPCALATSLALVSLSALVVGLAIWLARALQVNPDNLSTLVAALYGDVSCVLTYGLFAKLMYSFHQAGAVLWPASVLALALLAWPALWYAAYKARETRELSLSSMPPMLAAIMVSLGSGAVLSLVVGRFQRIALYQPVVNGFGANLIAVQASRVSTWLWCNALRRLSTSPSIKRPDPAPNTKSTMLTNTTTGHLGEFETPSRATTTTTAVPYGSLASFATMTTHTSGIVSSDSSSTAANKGAALALDLGGGDSTGAKQTAAGRLRTGLAFAMRLLKLLLWSFCNASPNSVAARLLLAMLIPAHSLYFIVIWLLSPPGHVTLTWLFYLAYMGLCLTQVFLLLLICEPLMSFLMSRRLDPDIFGISLLMALADLIGTLCLTGAFMLLAGLHDPNA